MFCFDFIFFWCEQRKEYKITEKNNKAGLNGKGNRWKCKENRRMETTERNRNGQTYLLNGKRARFGRILGMEIGDNVGSVSKFVGR